MSKDKNKNTVRNLYELENVKKNSKEIPNPAFNDTQIKLPCRMLVVSGSGGGKTNFVFNFIAECSKYKKTGSFIHIHIVNKINEPLYEELEKLCKEKITFYKTLAELPEPKDLEPKNGHNLVIFDDIVAEKNQSKIDNYFLYGRKINGHGCSCIYISQKYYGIPKIVRAQATNIILLKIRGNVDFTNICRDVNIGLDTKELKKFYKIATAEFPNFFKITCNENDDNKIISKNWNEFFKISHLLDGDNESDD
jgi:hypothetical protein